MIKKNTVLYFWKEVYRISQLTILSLNIELEGQKKFEIVVQEDDIV